MTCCLFFVPSSLAKTFQVCEVCHGVTSACNLTVVPSAIDHSCADVAASTSIASGRAGSSAIFFSGRGPLCNTRWNIAWFSAATGTSTRAALLPRNCVKIPSKPRPALPGFNLSSTAAPLFTDATETDGSFRSSFCRGADTAGCGTMKIAICLPWVRVTALAP